MAYQPLSGYFMTIGFLGMVLLGLLANQTLLII